MTAILHHVFAAVGLPSWLTVHPSLSDEAMQVHNSVIFDMTDQPMGELVL
jgi:hypothetical protein